MKVPSVLVTGFTEDVELVRSALPRELECHSIDQTASEQTVLPPTSIVAYVFSPDTASSSQLLGVYSWINSWTPAAEQYVVGVGGVNFERGVFHFAEKLPRMTLDELCRKLQH